MSKKRPEKSASKIYRSIGDKQPSAYLLRKILYQAQSELELPKNQSRANLVRLALRSEVYLDLTIAEPAQSMRWLRCASLEMNKIEALKTAAQAQGAETFYRTWVPVGIAALLRRAELPSWKRMARGQPVQHDYDKKLRAAQASLAYLPDPSPSRTQIDAGRTKLIEFMPLLLGSRRESRRPGQGWFGRLGLAREECRERLPEDCNPNWDVGVACTSSPELFAVPPVRLSIKRRFRGCGNGDNARKSAYQNAGVLPVSARTFGFADPDKVILGCVHEAGSLPLDALPQNDWLNSDDLDSITDQLSLFLAPSLNG